MKTGPPTVTHVTMQTKPNELIDLTSANANLAVPLGIKKGKGAT
jgi:hypothetical protein